MHFITGDKMKIPDNYLPLNISDNTKFSFYDQNQSYSVEDIFKRALRAHKLTKEKIQYLISIDTRYIKIIVDLPKEERLYLYEMIDVYTLEWMLNQTENYKTEVHELLREFVQDRIAQILMSNLPICEQQSSLLNLCEAYPVAVEFLLERKPIELSRIMSRTVADLLIEMRPDFKGCQEILLEHLQKFEWPQN